MPITFENPNVRFAISLLNYGNSGKAINDEVMIDKNNGKLYYKRSNGTIVSYIQDPLAMESNVSLLSQIAALNLSSSDIYDGEAGSSLLLSIEDNLTMVDKGEKNLMTGIEYQSFELDADSKSNYFFINVRCRETDQLYLSYIDALMHDAEPETDGTDFKINYSVTYTTGDNVKTFDGSTAIKGNVLCKISLLKPEDHIYVITDETKIKVSIKSIEPLVSSYYNPTEQKTIVGSIIPPDELILADCVQISYFADKIGDVTFPADSGARLRINAIMSTYEALDGMSKMIVNGQINDRVGLIENKLATLPRMIYSMEEPNEDEWTAGDVWFQTTLILDENYDVLVASPHYDKTTLETKLKDEVLFPSE